MSYVYLKPFFAAECELACRIARLVRQQCQRVEPITTGLAEKQPEAVLSCCTRSLSIVTGAPGTGKTTTLKCIVQSFRKAGMQVAVACPTGKAAKRADEVINSDATSQSERIACMTAHRMLCYNHARGQFTMNRHNPFPYDVVIMDEFSMGDCPLMNSFFAAIDPKKTRVILCGDWHQLPSVGPGNVARDMILSGVIPTVELDYIFRTGPESGIARNAARMLRGESLVSHDPVTGQPFEDIYFIPIEKEWDTYERILSYATERIPEKRGFNPLTEIQVLSPGKKSTVGTAFMNDQLRDVLNPESDKASHGGFRIGDKVINLSNNLPLGVVNGDVGHILDISKTGTTFNFGPGAGPDGSGYVECTRDNPLSIGLAYCFTVHKSQGSEFSAVLMPVHRCHSMLLFRNLIYTGITRAKKLACLIGDPVALQRAIANNATEKRQTNLQSRLRTLLA